jgi:phytoene desaturase
LGVDVTVFEKNANPGGKIGEVIQEGFRFDTGPSLLTWPSLIDELFLLSGKSPRDYFRYQKLNIVCEYFYPDGTRITAFADKQKFAAELFLKTGEEEKNVLHYLEKSRQLFELTEPLFLQRSLHRSSTYFTAAAWRALFKLPSIDTFQTLHGRNKISFQSEKVTQLFDRYATYNGSDPYRAPATLKLIPHLEYNGGAYLPDGGMYEIIRSLLRLAGDCGVKFNYRSQVQKLNTGGKKITGLVANDSEFIFDYVISNMDVYNTYAILLKDKKQPKNKIPERSTAALVFYWGMRKRFEKLDLHNIFFSGNYRKEFDFLERGKDVYDDPTVYVNITSKKIPGDAADGKENWFVMINVPCNNGQDWKLIRQKARRNIIDKLSKTLRENIESLIESESVLDPVTMEEETFSYKGALYGSSSNSMYSAFLRHKNFSSRYRNLFFCGGSVHPGGGIPLCLLSAKIVSEMIQRELRV